MKTRKEMIYALTKYELEYLQEYPECLEDNAKFFAGGGFAAYTDEQLIAQCQDNVWLELEGETI
jgi:hypothetical protein